jgi:hypothetical protein
MANSNDHHPADTFDPHVDHHDNPPEDDFKALYIAGDSQDNSNEPEAKSIYSWTISCITVSGMILGIRHSEFRTMQILNMPDYRPRGKSLIIAIRSNEGVIYNDDHPLAVNLRIKLEKNHLKNRRKRAMIVERSKNKGTLHRPHKLQGKGIEFNSVMCFFVSDPLNLGEPHIYNAKVFRDGACNALGIKHLDCRDYIAVVTVISQYFDDVFRRFNETFPPPAILDKINQSIPEEHIYSAPYYAKQQGGVRVGPYKGVLYKYNYDVHLPSTKSISLDSVIRWLDDPANDVHQRACGVNIVDKTLKHSFIWVLFESTIPKQYITTKITSRGKINLNGHSNKEELKNMMKFLQWLVALPQFVIDLSQPIADDSDDSYDSEVDE